MAEPGAEAMHSEDSSHTGAASPPQEYDILIAGAGLVGASLAALLCQEQPSLRVGLLDAAPEPAQFTGENFDPRVVALSPASQALLERLQVWPRIVSERACPYRRMHVWDAEGTGSTSFSCDELHLPALGHIVENSLVVRCLHERLKSLTETSQLSCLFGQRLQGLTLLSGENARPGKAPVVVTLESGETLESKLLIAADGATSTIRTLANFRTREWDYGHSAIVTTVRTAQTHEFTAWQRFQTTGPLAFLPLQVGSAPGAQENHSSIVWSVITPEAQRLMELDEAAFCRELEQAFEQRLGAVESADRRVCIPLQQRHAVRYWQPGVVLVGDAAHSLHPLAGQGVNLGLQDAQVLGEEIVRACQRSVPLTDLSILKRYERNRQSHNLAAMATMETFKRLFAAEAPGVRWLRNAGMAFVDQQSWLKKRLARLATGA